METIIVVLIVGIVSALMIRSIIRKLTQKETVCDCGGKVCPHAEGCHSSIEATETWNKQKQDNV
ncbi:MAG: hypothetical protein P9M15_06690 [Candidatus Electryoneaceae bacterium]|nr:hypothetical protein [Candidatus Electryoneaceae bacterium]